MSEDLEVFDNQDFDEEAKRPTFLTVLSILSWVWGGLVLLISLVMLGMKDTFLTLIEEAKDTVRTDAEYEALEITIEYYDVAMYTSMLGYTLSIIAVIMMYRLSKAGFYLYAAVHTIIMVIPYTYTPIGTDAASIFGLTFSIALYLAFILMYASNLKYMKS